MAYNSKFSLNSKKKKKINCESTSSENGFAYLLFEIYNLSESMALLVKLS